MMKNNYLSNWNMPDFSQFAEIVRKTQEMIRPIVEAVQRVQEVIRPLVEIATKYREQIANTLVGIAEIARPFAAIRIMGEAQFVYWDMMDSQLIDELIESNNPNKTLRAFVSRNKFVYVNNTIDKCLSNAKMQKHLRLFSQSVNAFRRGDSDLAVNGFTSVLDGLLSDISGNVTHSLKPRIKAIEDKLENDAVLDNEEYAMLTLALTFHETMETFSERVLFSEKEPKGLNRHWIAHGRSRRKKTKLDCVKLINLIYGLLLINEVEEKVPTQKSS